MCKIDVVDATAEHADRLIRELRPQDRAECAAAGVSVESAVLNSMGTSKLRKAVFFNEEFVGVYGISPAQHATLLAPAHYAWFLSTKVVEKYPKTFFKLSLLTTHQLSKKYGRLINFVDERYQQSLDWLERIGFRIGPRAFPGPHGVYFIEVTRDCWEEV